MNHVIKKILTTGFLLSVSASLVACGSGSDNSSTGSGNGGGQTPAGDLPAKVQDAIDGPLSGLTQNVRDTLTYMYSEEGLAHDIYLNIYSLQPVKQLENIAKKSEVKHIDAVNQLARKYDLNMTQYPDTDIPYSIEGIGNGTYPVAQVQYLYNILYDKGIQSQKDALGVGCMVEVVDITDLDDYIKTAQASNASDVLTVFEFLRDGSYNHYWAFDKGLKNMGITEGCCSVPDALGYHFCHPEYPQNDQKND